MKKYYELSKDVNDKNVINLIRIINSDIDNLEMEIKTKEVEVCVYNKYMQNNFKINKANLFTKKIDYKYDIKKLYISNEESEIQFKADIDKIDNVCVTHFEEVNKYKLSFDTGYNRVFIHIKF